jgi:AraC-like DNA-binding protein
MKILTQNIDAFIKPGTTSNHTHPFWQLDYYFNSETKLKTKLNGVEDYLDDTRAILVPPGNFHQITTFSPCRISTFKFMPEDNSMFEHLKAQVIELADYQEIMDNLFSFSIIDDPVQKDIINHYLHILLLRFLQNNERGRLGLTGKSLDPRLNEAIFYMKRNLSNNISLDKLAIKAGMSLNHFVRCFKKEFGMTPMRYVRKQIARKAIFLLSYSEMTLSKIAESMDFPDQHSFSRAFSRETGLPPGAYRKMQKEPGQHSSRENL